jgi:hydrogen peroxide-dependent heme synthase
VPEELIFASYPVFKSSPERLEGVDREVAAKEVADLLDRWSDKVTTRGCYSTVGFSSIADLMFWWVATSADDVQAIHSEFRQTQIGRALDPVESFLGIVRPAEFARDHQPAFVQGREPQKYLNVYPFVRTADWYLLESSERATLLRDHGMAAAEFKDVGANTTSAFGLGDFEWILAFEAESLDRIVDLIRALRATEARRYTKHELPFFTGIRRPIEEVIAAL